MEAYDLAILGGGPAGYLAAERAAASGMRTALFEAENIGGVCLNEGCIPTKVMLNTSKLLYYAKHGEAYGVVPAEKSLGAGFGINHTTVMARKAKVIKTLVAGVRAKLKASGADVFIGRAEINGRRDGRYIIAQNSGQDAGRQIEAAKILIATGSAPIIPKIDGIGTISENGFFLTSREALSLPEIPKKLVIVGGGVIGLELADYFNAAGSSVTIVELLGRIANPMDEGISKILLANLKKRGVEFRLGARFIGAVQPDAGNAGTGGAVIIENSGANAGGAAQESGANAGGQVVRETLQADKVLLSIGRRPNASGLGLEELGACVERGAIITDEYMRTNIPGVYAAGDVNGKIMLAHTAYREADCAVAHMLGKPEKMRYDIIPSVIYTNPEAAGVGETEESAAAKGLDVKTVSLPMRYSGRYVAETEGGDGICKIIFDKKNGAVAGVHMAGSYASEIILSAAFMIESRLPADALGRIVFPHPTVGEVMREALREYM